MRSSCLHVSFTLKSFGDRGSFSYVMLPSFRDRRGQWFQCSYAVWCGCRPGTWCRWNTTRCWKDLFTCCEHHATQLQPINFGWTKIEFPKLRCKHFCPDAAREIRQNQCRHHAHSKTSHACQVLFLIKLVQCKPSFFIGHWMLKDVESSKATSWTVSSWAASSLETWNILKPTHDPIVHRKWENPLSMTKYAEVLSVTILSLVVLGQFHCDANVLQLSTVGTQTQRFPCQLCIWFHQLVAKP